MMPDTSRARVGHQQRGGADEVDPREVRAGLARDLIWRCRRRSVTERGQINDRINPNILKYIKILFNLNLRFYVQMGALWPLATASCTGSPRYLPVRGGVPTTSPLDDPPRDLLARLARMPRARWSARFMFYVESRGRVT